MNHDATFTRVYLWIVITVAPIVAATSSDDQAIVNKIRADESHLRALVVILSLAGGLALSFGLGAGICLYWHLREFRRKKHLRKKPTQASSSSCPIEDVVVTGTASPIIIVTPSFGCGVGSTTVPAGHPHHVAAPAVRAPSSPSSSSAQPSTQVIVPPMVDTRVTNEGVPQPGPSAPSAKEILQQQQDEVILSSNHRQPHCCYHTHTPPPAYTPRTVNHLLNDPDIAPAVLFAIGRFD